MKALVAPSSMDGAATSKFAVIGMMSMHRQTGPSSVETSTRPIFGVIRYMSSDNTARKFRVKGYLEKYNSNVTTLP